MRPRASAALLSVLLVSVACSRTLIDSRRPGIAVDKSGCLTALAGRVSACPPFKALVQFTRVSPDGSSRRTMGLVYSCPPEGYRLDLLGGLGGTIMEVRFFRDSVAVFLPEERVEAVSGVADLALLADLGLPRTDSLELSLWLLGTPEPGWMDGLTVAAQERTVSGCHVVLKAGKDVTHEVWFDPDRRRLSRYVLTWPGGKAEARYDNFRRAAGADRPFLVDISGVAGRALRLEYRQIVELKDDIERLMELRSGPDVRRVGIEEIRWEGEES